MKSAYFNKLNYTLANEDTSMEYGILPEHQMHVMSVAGSGGRILPLLGKYPKKVTCVDVSQEQLYLCEMRFESLRVLSHSEFLAFWGYPPSLAKPKERKELFERLKLSQPTREFFLQLFEGKKWESILYEGKWERMIAKLSKVNRTLTGLKGVGLFSAMSDSEHFEYLERRFPKWAWNATILLLGNAHVFNSLLYGGHFPKKNLPASSYQLYQAAFQRMFEQGPARRNFLLQLLFFGRILFPEGNPIECDPEVFRRAKEGLAQAEIRYVCGDIIEAAEKSDTPIDLISLSDVPSYFDASTEKNFIQKIRNSVATDGLVIIRNYLRMMKGTDVSGFSNKTLKYLHLIQEERVQVYSVDVLQKVS